MFPSVFEREQQDTDDQLTGAVDVGAPLSRRPSLTSGGGLRYCISRHSAAHKKHQKSSSVRFVDSLETQQPTLTSCLPDAISTTDSDH